jgi:hypothetical protein
MRRSSRAPSGADRMAHKSMGVATAETFTAQAPPNWVPSQQSKGVVPRCLSRAAAASYVGVSEDLFDRLCDDKGPLPPPLEFGRRRVWDRLALDRALDRMSGMTQAGTDRDRQKHDPVHETMMEAIRAVY